VTATSRRHLIHVTLFLCVGVVTSTACSSTGSLAPPEDPAPSNTLYISGVPFFPQLADQCGPASLAAVLNYWGKGVTPDEIATAIYSPRLKGTLSLDMWQYAQNQQLQADMRKGSIEDLERHLTNHIPVIAFLNLGFDWLPVGHFVVVVGLDQMDRAIITYNGKTQNSRISYDRFLHAWQKTNYWTLVVQPHKEV
jgi:ABC-type bacteriocin/lantibiotic exporter with double-glycine peptidase domain